MRISLTPTFLLTLSPMNFTLGEDSPGFHTEEGGPGIPPPPPSEDLKLCIVSLLICEQ